MSLTTRVMAGVAGGALVLAGGSAGTLLAATGANAAPAHHASTATTGVPARGGHHGPHGAVRSTVVVTVAGTSSESAPSRPATTNSGA